MKKKKAPVLAVIVLLLLVAVIGLVTRIVKKYTPTSEVMDTREYFKLDQEDETAVILDNLLSDYKGKMEEGICYVDYDLVRDRLNERFYWDSQENLMLYTTSEDIIEIPAGGKDYTATGKTSTENYVIVKID